MTKEVKQKSHIFDDPRLKEEEGETTAHTQFHWTNLIMVS